MTEAMNVLYTSADSQPQFVAISDDSNLSSV